jgi:hypothetical protein
MIARSTIENLDDTASSLVRQLSWIRGAVDTSGLIPSTAEDCCKPALPAIRVQLSLLRGTLDDVERQLGLTTD